MHRIDNASANAIKPARGVVGPKPNAFFDDTSQTIVPADFMNAVQEELVNVLVAAGLVPDKADDTQVLAALDLLYKTFDSSATVKGLIELATTAEVIAGLDAIRAITPATLQTLVASTVAQGIVELATNAETLAGTDTERAVTPAALKASHGKIFHGATSFEMLVGSSLDSVSVASGFTIVNNFVVTSTHDLNPIDYIVAVNATHRQVVYIDPAYSGGIVWPASTGADVVDIDIRRSVTTAVAEGSMKVTIFGS